MDFPPDLKNLISELTDWYLPGCIGLCIIFGLFMGASFSYYSYKLVRTFLRRSHNYRGDMPSGDDPKKSGFESLLVEKSDEKIAFDNPTERPYKRNSTHSDNAHSSDGQKVKKFPQGDPSGQNSAADGFRRSCSIRSDSSRSGPSREDHSFSDNSRSLEERTSSNASTSRNSGERPRKMDAEQVVSILSKPVNFFEDRCEPQDSIKTLPTHFEQSSYDDHRRQSVVPNGQGASNDQRPVENDIRRTNLESTKRDRTFGDNAAGGDFLVQTPPSKQSSSRLSQGVATERAGKHGAQYATDSNSASYRSADSNTADPQHFNIRSQQISGQKTGTSNIIDSRNSRNKNSPVMNQSSNCRNYETLYQNVSDLQKRTRCNESVSEVTPEGSRTFDRRSNSSRSRPSREDHFYNDHSRNLEEQTSSNASTSRNSVERPRKMDEKQVVSDLSKPVNFFDNRCKPQYPIKTLPIHPKQSSYDDHRRRSVVPDTKDGDSETPAKDMKEACRKLLSQNHNRKSNQDQGSKIDLSSPPIQWDEKKWISNKPSNV